jgi:3-deoxy-manno-octulosonate cytidylyltransferase (CMP-KDO synthetase)
MVDGCVAIIPARFGASRFPGKLLAELGGRTVLSWVVSNALRADRVSRVVVTTDDDRLAEVAADLGADVHRSRPDHETGSDRVGEAARALALDDRVVVNLQGDEPFLGPLAIDACVSGLEADAGAEIVTLATPCPADEVARTSVVKVVVDNGGRAVYFSRSAIPWAAEESTVRLKHVGIYAFRARALSRFLTLPRGRLELVERLEQLRAIEARMPIGVVVGSFDTVGIDTPADLERARTRLSDPNGTPRVQE